MSAPHRIVRAAALIIALALATSSARAEQEAPPQAPPPAPQPSPDGAPAPATAPQPTPSSDGAPAPATAPQPTPSSDSAPAPATAPQPSPRALPMGTPAMFLPRRTGLSWDLELGLGLRLYDNEDTADLFAGRVRAGVLWVYEPSFVSLGATAEIGGLASLGFGAQLSYTHLYRGLWGQLGASWLPGDDGGTMASLGAGWSLFGLEWQIRDNDEQALLFHLRLPLGTTWFLFTHKPRASSARIPASPR
ncbi:hypothetical protein [Haliangium sp.]|uniref:hypothetical protein n=1 Tax=Haliangium sp. TaxID=2663208 RepID=UPI003D0A8F60